MEVFSETPKLHQVDIKFELTDGVEGKVTSGARTIRPTPQHTDCQLHQRSSNAKYLKTLMEGNEPLDHLPRMYCALQRYAGSFEHCEDQM